MAQWGNHNQANQSPNWGAALLDAGSGATAIAANNTALFNNVTVGAFKSDAIFGVFGAQPEVFANTSGESKAVAHAGWQLRKYGVGGINSFTVTAAGSTGYANGETVLISGGDANATGIITTTALGNVASVSASAPGLFANTTGVTYAYQREKHVTSFLVTNGGTGYHNTNIVTVTGTGYKTAAVGTPTTDGAGNVQSIAVNSGFVGLFGNTMANNATTVTFTAANGAVTNGTSGVFQANLVTSSGTGYIAVNKIGGRSGRVQYETLVAMGSITANVAGGTGSNTTQLPIT